MVARKLSRPPTLHLIVGLPGSGKTTLARSLEREHDALRLCPDEWIARLYGNSPSQPVLDGARDPMEQLQWTVAASWWKLFEPPVPEELSRRPAEIAADLGDPS